MLNHPKFTSVVREIKRQGRILPIEPFFLISRHYEASDGVIIRLGTGRYRTAIEKFDISSRGKSVILSREIRIFPSFLRDESRENMFVNFPPKARSRNVTE